LVRLPLDSHHKGSRPPQVSSHKGRTAFLAAHEHAPNNSAGAATAPAKQKGLHHMARTRLLLIGITAALATCATAAASAYATEPFFSVNGSAVTALTDGTFTSGTSHLRSKIAGIPINIISTLDTGTFSIAAGGKGNFTVSFTGGTVEDEETKEVLTKCTVEKLVTFFGSSQLNIESDVEVKGNTPPVFAEFSITGSSCAVKVSKAKIEGTASGIGDNENSVKLHDLEFEAAHESLKFDGEPATFESVESLELNSGAPWSGLA
jgi:hypothetical protein